MSLRIHGNRQLKTLPGQATRPTPARVREALFNIWQGELEGCRWLDLCAGTGAMGAEALCRGAAAVVGIEQSSRACTIVMQNWQQVVQANQQFQVIRGDVAQKLPTLAGQQFDRIYFDPPYASSLYQPVIEAIAHYHLLAPDGELAVEHSPAYLAEAELMKLTRGIANLEICRHKKYGNTCLSFYSAK
jgi:16S rRNA (guanine(966)-N(2))-methyltransferase RsmD